VVSTFLYLVLPLAFNVIAIVLLALTRTWIALGALAAIGAAFLLTLVGAIVVMAVCFATY
jgi:hypothetical protein